ncbi:MAG: MFS transporter [Deltaproteobacteria bacterium]|nr:MFS transporter [Deltaproteobacteria bacterium]
MSETRLEQARKGNMRWLILVLVSVTLGTNYYAYDTFSAIKDLLTKTLNFSDSQYGLIVGVYAFPNTFLGMAIIGGIILDRIGIRKTGLLFTSLCFFGVALVAYGASDYYRGGGVGYAFFGAFLSQYSPELKMIILGRLLFGMGAETSIVVINKVIAKWFKAKELAFAFALNVVFGRLGTAAVLILSPILIKSSYGWTWAAWVATILMGGGLITFVVHNLYDKAIDPVGEQGGLDDDEVFRLGDLLKLLKNRSFLLISALCVTFYSAVFPFQAFCPSFLHHKFGLVTTHAGFLTSLIIWGTILFTPLFGYLVDRIGKRSSMMVAGSLLLLIAHLSLSLTNLTPYFAMFVLGIAFSLVPAAMWPSVPLIVDEKRLGTAYGLMTSIQNLGLFAFPVLAGMITDHVNADAIGAAKAAGQKISTVPLDYTYTILMFAGLGIFGLVFAFGLLRSQSGPRLEQGALPDDEATALP